MSIPNYQTLMLPVLRFLRGGEDRSARAVIDAMSDEFDLPLGEREQMLPSQSITVIASRVHWAMTYLAKAELTSRPSRGVWRITEEGRKALAINPSVIDLAFLNRYPVFREYFSRFRGGTDLDEEDTPEGFAEASQESAGLPSVGDLLRPFLEAIVNGESRSLPEVVDIINDRLGLHPEARNRRLPSGRNVIENRTGWTRTSLLKAGLVDQPTANVVMLTAAGADFILTHPGRIDGEVLKRDCPSYANWLADMGDMTVSERFTEGDAAVWMVRAGEGGALAPVFVESSAVLLGWGPAGDVAGLSRDRIAAAVAAKWPDYRRVTRGQATNALHRFAAEMRLGDVVITPEPRSRTLLLGRIAGDYRYLVEPVVGSSDGNWANYQHMRPVQWIARITRDELSYGARNSLSTQMSLSRPPHEAELLRVAELHKNGIPPAPVPLKIGQEEQPLTAHRVVIPPNASAPSRIAAEEFQTYARGILQLLAELDSGQLALPDFQRSFVWDPDETRELLVSLIRHFPAGALLFLQGGSGTFKAREAEGAPALTGRPSFLVLDGQQRLTSLYQAIYGVGESRFFLDVGALLTGADINEAVRVMSAGRASGFATLQAQAHALMMPVSAVRDYGAARWRDEVVPLRDEEDPERLRNLLREVEYSCIDPLVKYSFPVTILPEATPLEAVCTIFETLNRTGRQLTPFELISARAFAGGHSLRDFWLAAWKRHPILEDFEVEPYYLMQCIALRLGRSCKRGAVLGLEADEIARDWDQAVADMAAALSMLRDECGVITIKWLPYRPMLIPLATAWREVGTTTGPAHGAMRAKLQKWFWCQCFTGEYESSSASLAERDAPVLRHWLAGGNEPDVVSDFAWDPQRWRTTTTRQQGIYRATMALMLVGRPRDFHRAAPLTPEVIEANKVDDHHVFPRGYLKTLGREGGIDSVLNHCLIDRATNVRIGKRPPSAYLAEVRAELGRLLDQVLESQQLPTGPDSSLVVDDFDGFLTWRVDRLRDALGALTGSLLTGATTKAGQWVVLDGQVETVELGLRHLLSRTLDDDASFIPSHVEAKITERLRTARRKNPALDNGRYETLKRRLEYCDLRDLLEVITAKRVWPAFEGRFGTKEMLNLRFGQLAELRNGIRHSRGVDEVTRMEGEAAVLWFRRVLVS
jgi:restriction endonuclease Mrr